MDPLQLTLRLIHVLAGSFWVGFAIFVAFYLGPALDDLGPESGKVMGALQRRGMSTVLPLLALATMASGVWLYWRASGQMFTSYLASSTGMTLGIGGLAAVLAFLLGMTVTRPTMMKAGTLLQSLPAAATPAERERLLSTALQLKTRGALAGRIGGALLILAAATMAVARYL